MEAIIFALVSYFTWGTGVFFEAIVARKLRWYSLIFWASIVSFLILSLYAPLAVKDLARLSFNTLILILILSSVGIFLGTVFYYEALRVGNRVVVGTIASSFPAVAVLLSIVFLGERVSGEQLASIVVIFTGLLLAIVDVHSFRSKTLINKATLLAVIVMFSWGTYFAFIKIPVREIGWFWPNYITFLLFPLILIYLKFKRVKLEMPTANNALMPLLVATVLVRAAELSYNLAISRGLVTIVAPIAGANPTLFVVLAFLIFKDPITKQQILGIITTLTGIVLLSIFSV